MLETPLISVVMAVFNGRATLAIAIKSLQLQTLTAWELILVDDCSTDGSGELACEFMDPRIRVIRNEHNCGLAVSLNRGIDLARAPLLVRMDSDDICFPRRLEMQYEFMCSHPEVDLVGGGALEFYGDGQPFALATVPIDHASIMSALAVGGTPLYHPAWCGRIEWFRRYYYDESFLKAQDCELLVRAASDSRYANLREVLIGYRREKFNLPKRLRSRWHVLRAYWKNYVRPGRYLDFTVPAMATLVRLTFDLLRAPAVKLRGSGTRRRNLGVGHKATECLAEWDQLRHNLASL